jgi:hypothetical protein
LVEGYQDVLNVKLGRKDGLAEALAGVNWRAAKSQSRERLLSELRALLLARALVDVEGKVPVALDALKSLALEADYVHAAAGQAWATIYRDGKTAESGIADEAVETEINELLAGIVERHPEQAESFPSLR